MESIERKVENYAIVFNVNLIRATLNEAVEFKEFLAEAINNSDKDLVVNLSACEHLDSTFLGVLVSSYKRLKSKNRTLVIIEPVDQSSIFLTLNSIGKIFPLYTSVKAALEDIENKKLLEKEINELSTEQIQVTEKLAESSMKFTSQLNEQLAQNPVVEEIKHEEFQVEIIQIDDKVETSNEVQKSANHKSWNLIDYKEPENDHLILSEYKLETPVLEEELATLETNESNEQQIVISHSRLSEDIRFGSEPIKWEFGFSS